MRSHTRRKTHIFAALLMSSIASSLAEAEPTRELVISGPREVLEGDPETASVDAHGQITMGPQLVELGKVADRPIMSLLAGPQGVLYAGTANGGILRITAGGEAKQIAKADDLVVTALAMYKGTLHAANGPDGRVLSVGTDGSQKTVFDPKAKYIWAIIEDGGDLIVATGEPGQIVRVTNGVAGKPLELGETHIRALIRHPKRGLIAGGGQKGIVYQIAGTKAFALYDSDMDECTALAVDEKTGDLYAAFVSESKPGSFDPEKSIGAVSGDAPESDTSPIKGSDVVRIAQSGRVDVLWTSKREGALGLEFDAKNRRLYIATGTSNKGRGRVYAVETGDRDRLLLAARIEPPMASALVLAGGSLIIGTAPTGQVLRIGPGLRSESVYISSEQDLQRSSTIGRLWFDADIPQGAKVEVAIRTGNTKEQDKTWSTWSADVAVPEGGDIKIPEGRYAQIRARLRASPNGKSPTVKSLHASVMRMNVAPTVQEIFALRRGIYMTKMPREEEKEKTVTLSKSVISNLRQGDDDDESRSVRVRQGIKPGMMTIAWRADDPNGDDLIYRLEMRRIGEEEPWQLLADDLEDVFYSFDSRTHRDGKYQFRVTASDRPSNPPQQAMTDRNMSEPVTIDNGPPKIKNLRALSPGGGKLRVEAEAEDETSTIGTAEFAVNGGPWLMLPAEDGLIDARNEKLAVDVAPSEAPGAPDVKAGRQTVLIRVEDEAGNSSTASTTLLLR
jgi:hypothetical protein